MADQQNEPPDHWEDGIDDAEAPLTPLDEPPDITKWRIIWDKPERFLAPPHFVQGDKIQEFKCSIWGLEYDRTTTHGRDLEQEVAIEKERLQHSRSERLLWELEQVSDTLHEWSTIDKNTVVHHTMYFASQQMPGARLFPSGFAPRKPLVYLLQDDVHAGLDEGPNFPEEFHLMDHGSDEHRQTFIERLLRSIRNFAGAYGPVIGQVYKENTQPGADVYNKIIREEREKIQVGMEELSTVLDRHFTAAPDMGVRDDAHDASYYAYDRVRQDFFYDDGGTRMRVSIWEASPYISYDSHFDVPQHYVDLINRAMDGEGMRAMKGLLVEIHHERTFRGARNVPTTHAVTHCMYLSEYHPSKMAVSSIVVNIPEQGHGDDLEFDRETTLAAPKPYAPLPV